MRSSAIWSWRSRWNNWQAGLSQAAAGASSRRARLARASLCLHTSKEEAMEKRIHAADVKRMALAAAIAMIMAPVSYADELPDANPLSGDQKAINSGKSWF